MPRITNKRIEEIAVALPISKFTKALLKDSYMSRLVAPIGPPRVRIYTGAKVRKLKAVLETRTKEIVLIKSGKVILKTCCRPEAPSIFAAS